MAATYSSVMVNADAAGPDRLEIMPDAGSSARAWLVGFCYWLMFLLVLEPGNIFGSSGHLEVSQEVLRISLASLLGSTITPLVLVALRWFPLEGRFVWRNAAIQLTGSLAVSAGLIVLSCIMADLFLTTARHPFFEALRREFKFNWLLVAFCTVTFLGFCQTRFARLLFGTRQLHVQEKKPQPAYTNHVAVKLRGEHFHLSLGRVDWIEAQGNYMAFHEGPRAHLVRGSLADIVEKLDPREFARIHRGAIVSLASVEGLTPLGSGDAKLRLKQGVELRLSRKYRAAFTNAWQGG